jgi:ABC-type thiamine transport system substrate-binding protein
MTAEQWNGWLAYSAIEPFGEYRSELRHGQLMQLTNAAHFKSDGEPKTVASFMNFLNDPEERQLTPEEIESALAGIFGV